MATHSFAVMTIKSSTWTKISFPTVSQMKNHHGYIHTAECCYAPKQQFAHPIEALGYNLWSAFFGGGGSNLFKFLEFLQRWAAKLTNSRFPWSLFTMSHFFHCFHVCLKKRQPQEKSCCHSFCKAQDTLLALQSEKVSENIFVCSMQNRMLSLNDAFVQLH